jgi:DNA replication protein DnaD
LSEGWIKLHRQIEGNEFYFDNKFDHTHAWIDLLLLANHKKATVFIRGIEIHLKPGELCYSQVSLAKRWKWNERTVNNFLKMLESRQMIHSRITYVTTIITICKWKDYQESTEQSTEQNTEQNTEQSADKQECKECKEEDNNNNVLISSNAISSLFAIWGKPNPGPGEIQLIENLLKSFDLEKIKRAFYQSLEQGENKCTLAYVKGILQGNGHKPGEGITIKKVN